MTLSVKSKIWLTIGSIVGVFTAFLLIVFPAQQERYFLHKYNGEVQNLARTVALGVKIAMTEQNFEGVQMALDFAKDDSRLQFVAIVQIDSLAEANGTWRRQARVLNVFPADTPPGLVLNAADSSAAATVIVKHAPITSRVMPGEIVVGFTTTEITDQMRQIRAMALGVSALIFAFGIGVGWWLARAISQPVLALRDAALAVGAGDRARQVRATSTDEIGELTVAFNKMVADLAAADARDQERARLLELSRDEAARALTDLKQTQSHLVHSEKMASLGQMTAGVAHEINNPINFVSVGIESLRHNIAELRTVLDAYRKLRPDDAAETLQNQLRTIRNLERRLELDELIDEAEQLFASIKNGARRTTEIVKSLRNFSRLDEDTLKDAQLEEGLDSTITIVHNQLKDRIRLEKSYAPLPPVPCYPGPLNQVFMNILTNAIQAIDAHAAADGRGTIYLTTAVEDGWATVRIRDTGPGMAPDVKSRIFDPFFTTKGVGTGTGLGLSITFGIIERHHGRIQVESAPGQGTEFIIRLPLTPPATA